MPYFIGLVVPKEALYVPYIMKARNFRSSALMELPARIAALQRYVELESPTGHGTALGTFTARLNADFTALGLTVTAEAHPTGDHLVCEWPATAGREAEAPLMFLAHSDTVWNIGTISDMPWIHDASSDTVKGPGTFDMKGGIIALQSAIRLVSAAGASHRAVTVVITADEEIGSPTSRPLIESHARGAYAVLGLEPPHPDGALKTSRWGSTRLRIAVTGIEAHAALDAAAGVSAIDELVDQLVAVRAIVANATGVLYNVGTITGGGRTNVVAGHAQADIGLRFISAGTESALLERLMNLAPTRQGAVLSVEVISSRPAWQPNERHSELLARIDAAAATVGQSIQGRAARGAADTNFSGRLGIASIDGLGPIGSGAHAVTEQIRATSLAERAALIAGIISEI
jgi:glutamate carboxypeptidase